MLNHATAQIFICLDPMDMRKSFDTLAQVVRANLGQDPLSLGVLLPLSARSVYPLRQ